MVDSDDLYGSMEVDDDLSTALGTETLADRDMVPPSFDNTPGSSANTLPIEIFERRRFLKVERSATMRSGQKVSKIWEHGIEYRALDTPQLDKYWKCNLCKQPKLLKIIDMGNTNTSHAIRHLKTKHKMNIKQSEDTEKSASILSTIP